MQLLEIKRLHLVEHLLYTFETEVLQDVGDCFQVLLNLLLLTLIYYSREDVRKNAELVEEPHFETDFEGVLDLDLVHFEDYGHAFEGVSEELGQVVVKVVVHKDQVLLEVIGKLIQIKENLLEVFLNECQDPDQLDVAQAGDVVVSYRMVLVSDQKRELDVQAFHQGSGFVVFRG